MGLIHPQVVLKSSRIVWTPRRSLGRRAMEESILAHDEIVEMVLSWEGRSFVQHKWLVRVEVGANQVHQLPDAGGG
ncbi:hypothetical protein VFPPC_15665 [Pochonia chlamydosporia 170]|uniref:Uncharacterized protein n=1 Tax=Pochonia chlamydosporia 170 TaxID=1380566 RepID=A0A179G0J1_METCM|nr:hypothetical protein VFPPC_15665 [Pochonia chlamydosporia 170]OAQ71217.1 hypothetical protein VFPPC_15665 [Pochonia chlamydosporia 170]